MNQLKQQLIDEVCIPYGYIYKLTSPSNKCYIGQTTRDIEKRWYVYKTLKCKCQPKLYAALKKYGPENFKYEIFDDTASNIKELNFLEEAYIAAFNSIESGYNVHPGGNRRDITEETRKKMSESHKGYKHSEDTRQRMSFIKKGRSVSKETRHKLSESKKGNQFGKANKGRKMSEEQKRILSEIKKGKVSPRKGKKLSEELKRQISETLKARKHSKILYSN